MIRKGLVAGAAAWAALSATGAQAMQASACMPVAEARAVMIEVAPSVLNSLAATCSALPPGSFVHEGLPAMFARYRAAANEANWALAAKGLKHLAGGGELPGDPELLRPLVGTLIAEELVGKFEPTDCGAADELLRNLDPLPPANLAGLFVAALRLSGEGKPAGKPLDIKICPAPAQ